MSDDNKTEEHLLDALYEIRRLEWLLEDMREWMKTLRTYDTDNAPDIPDRPRYIDRVKYSYPWLDELR
jgi:hypothetical protein